MNGASEPQAPTLRLHVQVRQRGAGSAQRDQASAVSACWRLAIADFRFAAWLA